MYELTFESWMKPSKERKQQVMRQNIERLKRAKLDDDE